ncbi:unnamed protein product [Ambrosiozyma monospora]|uniref:Unnamed protein product n=1 Tax=Ambrosiozyma monospora TaxID=43982 RepID=A0A9W7DID1_AMBMO|nr:unnamed protein product [Ambrosiozyma monospora]
MINLICNESAGDNFDGLKLDSKFDQSLLKLPWESKHCCASAEAPDDDKKSNPDKGDDSSGWGFLTWLFILLVLIFAAYIVGQAWINTSSMGNSSEFFTALVDSIVETCSKLPELIKEILAKVTGGGGNRGGYSAV